MTDPSANPPGPNPPSPNPSDGDPGAAGAAAQPSAPIYPAGPLLAGPPGATAPSAPRAGLAQLRATWSTVRSRVLLWWYSPGVHEVRVAWHDARRAPGVVVGGLLLACWIGAGFTWFPLLVGAAGVLAVQVATMPLRYRRYRWRRRLRPLAGVVAMVWLVAEAGPWSWLLGAGLWLLVAAVSDTWRARRRLVAWILLGVAHTARVEPETLRASHAQWDGRRLVRVEVSHGAGLRTDDPSVRDRVARSVGWRLRHAGPYRVSWTPGMQAFEIEAEPPLPGKVYDQLFPPGLPGIPVGVTDTESADGEYEVVDSGSGQVIARLPLVMDDPDDRDRHKLVIGGTGGGKTTFLRGYIARGIRLGWFPGGVYILDGKGSGDYIVFEGREGVHCVARDADAWNDALERIKHMMRHRYEEEADYERGMREKPDHPRYLVVLEEAQQIRDELTPKVMDAFTQQLARQMRASNGLLAVSTQRPDVADAVPGAVRDMLEDRYVFGFVSADGARMALGQDWRAAVDEFGAEPVAGRGVAKLMGRLVRVQGFALDSPRRVPAAEVFYPPKRDAQGSGARQDLPKVADINKWSPRRSRPSETPATEAADAASTAASGSVDGDQADGRDGAATPGQAATARSSEGAGEAQGDPFRRGRRTV